MTEPTTIRALLDEAEAVLADGPHPERARRDARTLLLYGLTDGSPESNLVWLIAHEEDPVAPITVSAYSHAIQRRLAGEPIQYITGQVEFYGLPFTVTRAVLIPRPETEHLVEKAIELMPEGRTPRIVDVGTGSGAIAVTLARECPAAEITAIDLSPEALDCARKNAHRNGVAERIRFLEGDLLAPVAGEFFDLVVSNPPYVPEGDRVTLAAEVRKYEPALALFAGPDGLDIYRRLIPAAFSALTPGGSILLEIGYTQRNAVAEMLAGAGFRDLEFTDDLQGIPRVAAGRRA